VVCRVQKPLDEVNGDYIYSWKSQRHFIIVLSKVTECPATYSEENKYLNTLLFCKFSLLEIMEGSEIVNVGSCPL